MAEQVAFTPKESFKDPDCLGTVFVSDTGDFNVRQAVQDGKGYIVVDDPDVIAVLDRYPALKRVAVSEAQKSAKAPARPGSSGDDK